MLTTIVFDVDGVILDSKLVKRDAWHAVFHDRAPEDDALLQDKVDAKVGDRYGILRKTGTAIGIAEADLAGFVDAHARRYDEAVRAGIRKRGTFPGVPEALALLAKGFRLHTNSGTPSEPLRRTLEEFGIAKYFQSIRGSECTKVQNLLDIALIDQVPPPNLIMIGDEEGDRRAAEVVLCRFVGIADAVNGWKPDASAHPPIIPSVAALPALLLSEALPACGPRQR